MTYINNLVHIKNLCRICLTQSDDMISLDSKLDTKLDNSPLILDALENIFSEKVITKEKYPRQVCTMCCGYIRISYDLKLIYNKSQKILEKYISLWDFADFEDLSTDTAESYLKNSVDCIKKYIPQIDTPYNCDLHSNTSNSEIDKISDVNNEAINLNLANTSEENTIRVNWVEENELVEESGTEILKQLLQCVSCCKEFMSKERLSEHLNICNKLPKNAIECEFGRPKFSSLSRTDCHVKMKHRFKVIKCEICNKTFKNNKALSYHNATQHNSEGKKFVCKVCKKGFYLKSGLSQHMDVHTRDVSKVICPVCGKGFHYRGGLFYHMKIHRNERNYICDYCNRKFLNISGLKKHIRTHTGERPYPCTFCGKRFLSKNILDNHEKTHTGLKTKVCPHCGKSFITAYSLKVHISSHAGNVPCEFCKRSFLNGDVLKLHMKFKHNDK